MPQVNPKYYDKNYFQQQSLSPDFNKQLKASDFQSKYQQSISLSSFKKNDIVCDYGCGTGDLSFLLSLKYDCQIIAIDYSPDAIKICKEKLKLFKKHTNPQAKIKFLNKSNKEIPNLKNIKTIFFTDVFEHLYDSEIKFLINKIKKWDNTPEIIVHTDNNNYLKFIQPIINTISLLLRSTTIKTIKTNRDFDKKRHINLTNPKELKEKMNRFNFQQIKVKYPRPSIKMVKNQLSKLAKFKFITNTSLFLIKKIPILSPSFFALYRFNSVNKLTAAS